MTENEIIKYLKENKNKGIGYRFLPEEVQKWIYENFYKKILVYFDYQGEWVSIDDINLTKSSNYWNKIFSLSEDFELKKKQKGKWVEFEISHQGSFFLQYKNKYGSDCSCRFHWSQWGEFLSYCWNYELSYTAFGGWQYKEDDNWSTVPLTITLDSVFMTGLDKEDKPAIPIKIRFWRK